jgi:hypothetical protein
MLRGGQRRRWRLRRVRMGEDHNAVQEQLESEPLTDSDSEEESQEVESEYGDHEGPRDVLQRP